MKLALHDQGKAFAKQALLSIMDAAPRAAASDSYIQQPHDHMACSGGMAAAASSIAGWNAPKYPR